MILASHSRVALWWDSDNHDVSNVGGGRECGLGRMFPLDARRHQGCQGGRTSQYVSIGPGLFDPKASGNGWGGTANPNTGETISKEHEVESEQLGRQENCTNPTPDSVIFDSFREGCELDGIFWWLSP